MTTASIDGTTAITTAGVRPARLRTFKTETETASATAWKTVIATASAMATRTVAAIAAIRICTADRASSRAKLDYTLLAYCIRRQRCPARGYNAERARGGSVRVKPLRRSRSIHSGFP